MLRVMDYLWVQEERTNLKPSCIVMLALVRFKNMLSTTRKALRTHRSNMILGAACTDFSVAAGCPLSFYAQPKHTGPAAGAGASSSCA